MLRGFEKVRLEPMETRRISFVLEPHHLALLDANLKWVVEPGGARCLSVPAARTSA
jgi:beta-glucosidase